MKAHRFLRNDSYWLPQVCQANCWNVNTVKADLALSYLNKTVQRRHDGRLSSASTSHNTDLLTTCDHHIQTFENRRQRRAIRQIDVIKYDLSLRRPCRGGLSFRFLVRSFLFNMVCIVHDALHAVHIGFYRRSLSDQKAEGLVIKCLEVSTLFTDIGIYLLNQQNIRERNT